jgi:hypothetical protein
MFWLRIIISFISIGVIIGRIIFPNIQIDSITLGLIIVAILPWLSSLIESAEFPGGWKIKFRDIKKAVAAAARMDDENLAHKEKEQLSYLDILERDPNLRLVALRLEIEKRVRMLAHKYKIEEQRSLQWVLESLMEKGILAGSVVSGLNELISVGNRAAHGAKVDADVINWATKTSRKFLFFLDRKLHQQIKNDNQSSEKA